MHLHIVSFDVPWPPDYGGAIDVYYRIKHLAETGVAVHLHCFQTNRVKAEALEAICEEVHYYSRRSIWVSLPVRRPYIVASRRSDKLLERLKRDTHPILFEGLHTCYYLDDPALKDRVKAVRLHNIEWQYYERLAEQEKRLWARSYYYYESRALESFESVLWSADYLLAISENDEAYLRDRFVSGVSWMPAFHPYLHVQSSPGQGEYCLYHGNLAIAENHEAALYLIREIFPNQAIPLVIAGANPRPELIQAINRHEHIRLHANPDDNEMEKLLQDAQVHVLPAMQVSGVKLKLLHALFSGRHVLVNPDMVAGSGLESLCAIAASAQEMRELCVKLYNSAFPASEAMRRQRILGLTYDCRRNALRLIQMLRQPGA